MSLLADRAGPLALLTASLIVVPGALTIADARSGLIAGGVMLAVLVIVAGIPFATIGTTNNIRVVRI